MAKSGEHRMLFDLRGRRKRLVQVVYAALALLMGGGLIFFGIGSSSQGGLFDALGVGNSSGGSSSDFDAQAQKLEQKLKSDPRDQQLLVAATRAWYTAANSQVQYDPATGAPLDFPQGAIDDFAKAGDSWQRYLATKPSKANPNVAGLAATSLFYSAASASTATDFQTSMNEAVSAQKVYAAAQPSLNSYVTLARYSYYSGDFAAGDAAAAKAAKETTKAQAPALKQAVAQYRKQGKQVAKAIKAANKFQPGGGGKQALENPIGGLSGGGAAPTGP